MTRLDEAIRVVEEWIMECRIVGTDLNADYARKAGIRGGAFQDVVAELKILRDASPTPQPDGDHDLENAEICVSLDYITVMRSNGREAIVYGSGSDWIAQLASVTNHVYPWRRWFGKRELAEDCARDILLSPPTQPEPPVPKEPQEEFITAEEVAELKARAYWDQGRVTLSHEDFLRLLTAAQSAEGLRRERDAAVRLAECRLDRWADARRDRDAADARLAAAEAKVERLKGELAAVQSGGEKGEIR